MKPKYVESQALYIDELAEAACRTNNPDIVWQIASVETGFNFEVVRFNSTATILTGEGAKNYLEKLKVNNKPINIDIGIMQVNWFYHRSYFDNDPLRILQPRNQVGFLVERMAPMLNRYCKKQWIGCYHNPANGERAKIYNRSILSARKRLEKKALAYLDKIINPEPPKIGKFLSQEQIVRFYDVAKNSTQERIAYLAKPKINDGALVVQIEKTNSQTLGEPRKARKFIERLLDLTEPRSAVLP